MIHLTDRVDALVAQHQNSDLLLARKPILTRITTLSGNFFDPALVKAFLETSASEAFWLTLESHHLERQINETVLHFADTRELTSPELMQLAQIFARIVDDKADSQPSTQSEYPVCRVFLDSSLDYPIRIANY